jgi:hypothetical protein
MELGFTGASLGSGLVLGSMGIGMVLKNIEGRPEDWDYGGWPGAMVTLEPVSTMASLELGPTFTS